MYKLTGLFLNISCIDVSVKCHSMFVLKFNDDFAVVRLVALGLQIMKPVTARHELTSEPRSVRAQMPVCLGNEIILF